MNTPERESVDQIGARVGLTGYAVEALWRRLSGGTRQAIINPRKVLFLPAEQVSLVEGWVKTWETSLGSLVETLTPKMVEASGLLCKELGKGPKAAGEMFTAGVQAGVAETTLRTTAKKIGVIVYCVGSPSRELWYWELPVTVKEASHEGNRDQPG